MLEELLPMLLLAVLSASLAAAPAAPTLAAARVTLTGIYNQRPETYLALVVTELQAAGLNVITPARARELLGEDRQEDLYACEEDRPGCARLLGQALGVEGVVVGGAARGQGRTGHHVHLQVLAAADGRVLATFYEGGVDESGLKRSMARGARLLALDLLGARLEALVARPALHSTRTDPFARTLGWGGLALTGAAAVTAAVAAGHRLELLNQPKPEHPLPGVLNSIWTEAESLRQLALGVGMVGVLAGLTTRVLLGIGFQDEETAPVITLVPGGAQVGVAFRW